MDMAVVNRPLAELLVLPLHVAFPPGVAPSTRALSDRLKELVWSLSPDKQREFVARTREYCDATQARRQRRLQEEWRP